MSMKVLAKVASELNNEFLGTVVLGLIEDNELSIADFGAMVRTAMGAGVLPDAARAGGIGSEPVIVDSPLPSPELSSTLPLGAARDALVRTVYDSFNNTYRRRSLNALSRVTGLTNDAVLELISDNNDFRVSVGRETGYTFVSVRGIDA